MLTSTKKYHVTLHIVFFTNEGLTKSRLLFDLNQLYTEININEKVFNSHRGSYGNNHYFINRAIHELHKKDIVHILELELQKPQYRGQCKRLDIWCKMTSNCSPPSWTIYTLAPHIHKTQLLVCTVGKEWSGAS